jgi:hypothetical protein
MSDGTPWTQWRLQALIEKLRDNPVENEEAHEAAYVIERLTGLLQADQPAELASKGKILRQLRDRIDGWEHNSDKARVSVKLGLLRATVAYIEASPPPPAGAGETKGET